MIVVLTSIKSSTDVAIVSRLIRRWIPQACRQFEVCKHLGKRRAHSRARTWPCQRLSRRCVLPIIHLFRRRLWHGQSRGVEGSPSLLDHPSHLYGNRWFVVVWRIDWISVTAVLGQLFVSLYQSISSILKLVLIVCVTGGVRLGVRLGVEYCRYFGSSGRSVEPHRSFISVGAAAY